MCFLFGLVEDQPQTGSCMILYVFGFELLFKLLYISHIEARPLQSSIFLVHSELALEILIHIFAMDELKTTCLYLPL